MPKHRISEYHNMDEKLAPTDIGETTANTGWIFVGDCSSITFLVMTAVDYSDTTCVITVKQATSSAGTNSQSVTGLGGTLDAANEQAIIEMNMDDMFGGGTTDRDYDYLMCIVSEVSNGGIDYASISVIKTGDRYKTATSILNSGAELVDNT